MVHVADSYDNTGLSGQRYILNPPGSQVTVHQHLDIRPDVAPTARP